MARTKIPAPPKYLQTYPGHLATDAELRAQGLKPGTTEPDAILDFKRGDISGLCALFERGKAVPLEPPS